MVKALKKAWDQAHKLSNNKIISAIETTLESLHKVMKKVV